MKMTNAYQILERNNAGFIANVIFTSCRDRSALLRKLAGMVLAGRELATASFVMPYEGILIDGEFTTLDQIRK